jgi:hypothetical protein
VIAGRQLSCNNPAAWAELTAAVALERGNLCAVARRLGVPLRTVQHWHAIHARLRAAVAYHRRIRWAA